jgi:hypothetical protein
MKDKLTFIVTIMVSFTLCVVIGGMVFALCIGLFDKEVNNDDIFILLGPAFQTIIGGFIGLLAGIKFAKENDGQ